MCRGRCPTLCRPPFGSCPLRSAPEVLQDVFVKALIADRSGRRFENLTGWLYAAARTTLIDHYRASGIPTEALDENIANAEIEDLRLHQELSTCLRAVAEQLTPVYRDTLITTDFDGQTMRTVAAAQQVSVSAIKSRASRARAMLKAKLLACCHIEMANGLVSDCCSTSPSGSGAKCR
jgi:RNA polymerase sigma-70 factor, ECF subfamily